MVKLGGLAVPLFPGVPARRELHRGRWTTTNYTGPWPAARAVCGLLGQGFYLGRRDFSGAGAVAWWAAADRITACSRHRTVRGPLLFFFPPPGTIHPSARRRGQNAGVNVRRVRWQSLTNQNLGPSSRALARRPYHLTSRNLGQAPRPRTAGHATNSNRPSKPRVVLAGTATPAGTGSILFPRHAWLRPRRDGGACKNGSAFPRAGCPAELAGVLHGVPLLIWRPAIPSLASRTEGTFSSSHRNLDENHMRKLHWVCLHETIPRGRCSSRGATGGSSVHRPARPGQPAFRGMAGPLPRGRQRKTNNPWSSDDARRPRGEFRISFSCVRAPRRARRGKRRELIWDGPQRSSKNPAKPNEGRRGVDHPWAVSVVAVSVENQAPI